MTGEGSFEDDGSDDGRLLPARREVGALESEASTDARKLCPFRGEGADDLVFSENDDDEADWAKMEVTLEAKGPSRARLK